MVFGVAMIPSTACGPSFGACLNNCYRHIEGHVPYSVLGTNDTSEARPGAERAVPFISGVLLPIFGPSSGSGLSLVLMGMYVSKHGVPLPRLYFGLITPWLVVAAEVPQLSPTSMKAHMM